MTIRHFRIFIAVASYESITKAAESLYLTQPTVSVAVRELEEHYGTRFFERINQRLKITEEGKSLLSYASHLIALYDEIETSFQNPDPKGTLRIGSSPNPGAYWIPDLVRRFQKENPKLKIHVRVSTTELIEKLLLDNELDLAVVGGFVRSPFLTLVHLFSENHIAVCSPDGPLAGKTVTLREFMEQPLLLREPNSSSHEAFQTAKAQSGSLAEPAWVSSSQEAILAAAKAGLGVTILPEKLAEPELARHTLAEIRISDFSFRNTVCLAYHKNKFISPAMKQFSAFLQADDGVYIKPAL